jgi:uncharacterized protein
VGSYFEAAFFLFWYLVVILLFAFPVLFAFWLWIVSLGTLIGQFVRNEVLSLKHIHLLLIPLTTLAMCYCYVMFMESGPGDELAMGKKCVVVGGSLLIWPYAGLLLYRYYQVKHPLKYVPGERLFLFKAPKGIALAGVAALIGVVLPIMIFVADVGPKRLLIYAAKTDNPKLVKLLVDLGTNVNTGDRGHSPLWFACRNGNREMTELLLNNGANLKLSGTVLYIASLRGRTEIVRFLLDRGLDVNTTDSSGYTALMAACQERKSDVVQLLLERGADVNAVTRDGGATALFYACDRDDVAAAKMLLEKGADPDLKPRFGGSPMLSAMRRDNTELIQLLKSYGAKEP